MKQLLPSAVILLLAVLASIAFGVRDVSFAEAFQSLLGNRDTVDQVVAAARLPRTVLGILAGAGLAVAGVAFQAVTRNPLADPGIFGVLHGAALAVVIGIVVGLHAPFTLAIIGSFIAGAFVFLIGSMGRGGATPLKLALAGAATSAVLVSLIRAVLLPREDAMDSFRHWQIGDIGITQWDRMGTVITVVLAALAVLWMQSGAMNALALGDETATSLGFNVTRSRLIVGIAGIVICGIITGMCGPIAFVGLIVPHLCRILGSSNHRLLVPFAAQVGASLLLVADVIGRLILSDSEIAVGILMPLLGAPVFVWIVRNYKVRELA